MCMRVEVRGRCVCVYVWRLEVDACVDACGGWRSMRVCVWRSEVDVCGGRRSMCVCVCRLEVFLHQSFTLFIFDKQQEILFKETDDSTGARMLKGSLTSLC